MHRIEDGEGGEGMGERKREESSGLGVPAVKYPENHGEDFTL